MQNWKKNEIKWKPKLIGWHENIDWSSLKKKKKKNLQNDADSQMIELHRSKFKSKFMWKECIKALPAFFIAFSTIIAASVRSRSWREVKIACVASLVLCVVYLKKERRAMSKKKHSWDSVNDLTFYDFWSTLLSSCFHLTIPFKDKSHSLVAHK